MQWNFPDPCVSISGITLQDILCFIACLAHAYTHRAMSVAENYLSACAFLVSLVAGSHTRFHMSYLNAVSP